MSDPPVVPQQGPQQDALTVQDWLTLDRIEQYLTTMGAITSDDAQWLVEHLTKVAKAASRIDPPVPSPGGDTALLRRAREALASTRYEFNSDYKIAMRIVAEIDAAVSSSSVADPWLPIETHDGSPMPALVAERGDVVEAYFSAERDTWWEINSCDDGAPGSDRRVNPTHWMPLPNPPSASSASAEADNQKKNTTI